MSGNSTRILLFLFACIPIRLLLTYAIKHMPSESLVSIGYISVIIAGLFILSYMMYIPNKRKGAFGGKIWWNDMRAVHGCIYLLFSLLAIKQNANAWIVLLFDVIIGLTAFLFHYWI